MDNSIAQQHKYGRETRIDRTISSCFMRQPRIWEMPLHEQLGSTYNTHFHFTWCFPYGDGRFVDTTEAHLQTLIDAETTQLPGHITFLELGSDHLQVVVTSHLIHAAPMVTHQWRQAIEAVMRHAYPRLISHWPMQWLNPHGYQSARTRALTIAR